MRFLVIWMLMACGPSARTTALQTSLSALDVAAASWHAYDKQHLSDIVVGSTSHDDGNKKLDDWSAVEAKVERAFSVAWQSVALAIPLSDDPSFKTALANQQLVVDLLRGLGVTK